MNGIFLTRSNGFMELAACLFEVDFSCLVPWGCHGMPWECHGDAFGGHGGTFRVPLIGMGCLGDALGVH